MSEQVTDHDYQPSLNVNFQGDCVICGHGAGAHGVTPPDCSDIPEQSEAFFRSARRLNLTRAMRVDGGLRESRDCRIPLALGRCLIDLADPHPDDVDLDAVHARLAVIRRFSGDPKALTVSAHSRVVSALARAAGASDEVIRWCLCHDMHEAFTGDIPAPVKRYLSEYTPALTKLETALDVAICGAMGIPVPSDEVRLRVRFFDKLSETMEWVHILERPEAAWNVPYTSHNVSTMWKALHGVKP
jgi:hypothetical protein